MSQKLSKTHISRRRFLATSAALTLPVFLPGCDTAEAPAQAAAPLPPVRIPRANGKINVGMIGCGTQGVGNMRQFLTHTDCQVVAACDVDKQHLSGAINIVNKEYGNNDCKPYHDFRELLARDDIDAVMLAVPDHWHELVAVEATRRSKDIYGEKPLARTIAEQQAIVRAVQQHGIIWQTGSWQRSMPNFHKAAEIVRNGLIGQVTHVEVGLPEGYSDPSHQGQYKTPSAPPPELDYDFWMGPSQMMQYIRGRVHKNWRWNYNTGGGQLMDWVGHHCDIAHWGLGFDRSGPLTVEGHGEFPPFDAVWNTASRYRIELKYPDNITMTMAGGYKDIRSGTKWIGTQGWVWVNRGAFEASNDSWEEMKQLPESLRKIPLTLSNNHVGNFLDSIRSRQPTITPAETAHHSAIPGHLGLISMLKGRKIYWDNETEKILHDDEASQMLSRPFRPPWKLA